MAADLTPEPPVTNENDIGATVEHADTPTLGHTAPRPRIALAHDWLVGLRGGEHVLDQIILALAPIADITRIYTLFDSHAPITPRIDALPHTASRLNALPATNSLRRWFLPLYPAGVAQLSNVLARDHAAHPIDLLLSTSSAAIKGLRPPPGVPHLCYCHSPARYVWSQPDQYASTSLLRGIGLRAVGKAFRDWDRASAANVSCFIANSTHTADEIRRCFGRESHVVHPPVRTDFFTPPPPHASHTSRGEHWLVVGAIEPYKRTRLAIDAAAAARKRIRVVGEGSDLARVRSFAGPHASFLGRLSDEALRDEYRAARLLIFPQIEDFGIVAAEAQSCGLPVLARAKGGALDIVRDSITGAHFHADAVESILSAAPRVPREAAHACRLNALRFSEDRFLTSIRCATTHALLRAHMRSP